MAKSVQILQEEHRRIGEQLDSLERAVRALDLRTIREVLDQLTWAISGHRQREVEVLYPAISAISPLARAAVEGLLHRHRFEWEHLRAARRIFDVPDDDTVEIAPLLEACGLLVTELRELTRREEREIFPLADELLGEREDAALLARLRPEAAPTIKTT